MPAGRSAVYQPTEMAEPPIGVPPYAGYAGSIEVIASSIGTLALRQRRENKLRSMGNREVRGNLENRESRWHSVVPGKRRVDPWCTPEQGGAAASAISLHGSCYEQVAPLGSPPNGPLETPTDDRPGRNRHGARDQSQNARLPIAFTLGRFEAPENGGTSRPPDNAIKSAFRQPAAV